MEFPWEGVVMLGGGEWSKRWAQLQLKQERMDRDEEEIKRLEKKIKELKSGMKKHRNELRVLIQSVRTDG